MALAQVPAELIEACQRGDKASIEALIEQVSPDLYRILYSMLHDHDDTDEVLQETLVRLFRYIGSLRETNRFGAWCMRIAVNQVQTHRVRKRKTRLFEIDEGHEIQNHTVVMCGTPAPNPRESLVREQVRGEITSAMEALPERQRLATVMFEIEGMSIREIAESLSCSEGAVKFNIHEGRKKLKRRLLPFVKGLRWGKRAVREQEAAAAGGSARRMKR